jgi:plasmid replication initiation protein
MATIQQELKPQPRETPDDDLDEMYEEEPRRRAWGAIASVVLALALVFVGYQWNQAATRAEALGAQVSGMRAEAETQRLKAEDAQRQVDVIQKRLAAISAEKDSLAERLVALEKAGSPRPVTAKAEKPKTATKATASAPVRPKATPVASRPTPVKRTP